MFETKHAETIEIKKNIFCNFHNNTDLSVIVWTGGRSEDSRVLEEAGGFYRLSGRLEDFTVLEEEVGF